MRHLAFFGGSSGTLSRAAASIPEPDVPSFFCFLKGAEFFAKAAPVRLCAGAPPGFGAAALLVGIKITCEW